MKRSIEILVTIIIWRKEGLLLLRRRRNFQGIGTGTGLWELPGGKLKWGESRDAALRREIHEETGWQLTRKFRWRNYIFYRLKTENAVIWRLQLLYNVRLGNKQLGKMQLSEEHDDFKYIQTATELNQLPMIPEVKTYLLIALTGQVWITPETISS